MLYIAVYKFFQYIYYGYLRTRGTRYDIGRRGRSQDRAVVYRAQHDKVQFVFEKRSTAIHINFDKEKTQPLGQNKNALRYLRRLRNQLGRIFRLASFRQRKHNGLIFIWRRAV